MTEQRERLLIGLAELLDAAGVGEWSPDGVTAEGGTGIYLIRVPESPERIISLRTYDSIDDAQLTEMTQLVQVRVRGGKNPLEALRISGEVYAVLHGLNGVHVCAAEPLHVVLLSRESEADIGPDSLGRYERTENYAAQLNSDHARLE